MNATGLPNPPRYMGQAKQKLQLMHQMNMMNQMQAQMMGAPGAPMGPGQPASGGAAGGGGEQIGQIQKEFQAGGKSSEMTKAGGEHGRAKQ